MRFLANLAPSWRPKTLQNRDRNPKKTMLKNDTFLTSIFKGFGRRFGLVFGRFFGVKMRSKSDSKKSARQAKSIGKTNTKSMSALLQQSIFRARFDEKSHVFWDVDFDRILGGFGERFGRPNSSISAIFPMFFRRCFRSCFSSVLRRAKTTQQDGKNEKPKSSAAWRGLVGRVGRVS